MIKLYPPLSNPEPVIKYWIHKDKLSPVMHYDSNIDLKYSKSFYYHNIYDYKSGNIKILKVEVGSKLDKKIKKALLPKQTLFEKIKILYYKIINKIRRML